MFEKKRKIEVIVKVGCPNGGNCYCDGSCKSTPTREERIKALKAELAREEINIALGKNDG